MYCGLSRRMQGLASFFLRVYGPRSRPINTKKKKNLANIQPFWPYAWLITIHIHILGIGLGTSLQLRLTGEHHHLWDRADLDTSFLNFEKSSPQPRLKVHLEIRFDFRSVLLDFQSFIEKLFECVFAHPMLFLSYLIKTSMDHVSVVCILAMKWYLMRMCTSCVPCKGLPALASVAN